MTISELHKKMLPEPLWQHGTLFPHQQPEVAVHYALDPACDGGRLKPRDSGRKGIPPELHSPPGAAVFGWWRGQHWLELRNGQQIDIIRLWPPDEDGVFRFTSSPDVVKEALAIGKE